MLLLVPSSMLLLVWYVVFIHLHLLLSSLPTKHPGNLHFLLTALSKKIFLVVLLGILLLPAM